MGHQVISVDGDTFSLESAEHTRRRFDPGTGTVPLREHGVPLGVVISTACAFREDIQQGGVHGQKYSLAYGGECFHEVVRLGQPQRVGIITGAVVVSCASQVNPTVVAICLLIGVEEELHHVLNRKRVLEVFRVVVPD